MAENHSRTALPAPASEAGLTERADTPAAKARDEGRRVACGSQLPDFNNTLLFEVLRTLTVPQGCNESEVGKAMMAAMAAFKPTNEIEGMLAAQAVAMHFGAMLCFQRAIGPNQPSEIATRLRRDGANLARGMTDMLDALNRQRGKGPQVVRVERVVVHEGGQAIVGNVQGSAAPEAGEG